jgi:DNA mismatch repair protein MutS
MAGMPSRVIERGNELLHQLEASHNAGTLGKQNLDAACLPDRQGSSMLDKKGKGKKQNPVSSIQYPVSSIQYPVSSIQHPASGYQLSFIQLDDPTLLQIKEDILNTDINTLTPVEALMKLNEIKKLLGK